MCFTLVPFRVQRNRVLRTRNLEGNQLNKYLRVTISADAGLYLVLAQIANHLGLDDPTYFKTCRSSGEGAECRLVGKSVVNSPKY